MRRVAGVIAGIVLAFVIVQAAEMGVRAMVPFPRGMDEKNMTAIKAFVATLPPSAFVLVLAGWLIGTLAGTFTAAKISRTAMAAYVTGALLLLAGIGNAVVIPQPVWFSIISFVIFIGMTLVGARAAGQRTSGSAANRMLE
jgi:hypothetical protein